MSWLSKLPTIPEVLNDAECLLVGHDWEKGRCKNCGKEKEKE